MSHAQYRPLGFGEILDGAFALYRRHFFPLFLTALIPMVPFGLAMGVFGYETFGRNPGAAAFGPMMLVLALSLVGWILEWAALTHDFSQAYTGQPVSLRDGFARGFRALLPMVGMGVLVYIGLMAVMMALMIPIFIVGFLVAMTTSGAGGSGSPSEAVSLVIVILAVALMLALIVGVAATLFAVSPAIVVERCGPIAAITRSFRLSKGARLRLAGIVAIGWIIALLPTIGVGALTGTLGQTFTGQPAASAGMFFFQQVFGVVASALTTPFWVGSLVLAYYDRRIRTEALDLQVAADALVPA